MLTLLTVVLQTLATSCVDDVDEAFIIMEFAGSVNMQMILTDSRTVVDTPRRLRWALSIASALQYIHDSCVAHLDIKPSNVIISSNDTCKLGDFGCSQVVEIGTGVVSPTQRSYLTGTFAYRAPELLRGEPPSTKADIYSFGITLWEMLARCTPYKGQDQHVVIFGVVAYGLRPQLPEGVDWTDPLEATYRDLFMQCWEARPADRPQAYDLAYIFHTWNLYL